MVKTIFIVVLSIIGFLTGLLILLSTLLWLAARKEVKRRHGF